MTQLSGRWLKDNAVSSNKILDGAVNAAKIDSTDSYTMQNISTTANITVGGILRVNGLGDSTISGGFRILGDSTIAGNCRILGDSTTNGNFSILGDSTVTGGLKVLGDFSISSAFSIPSLTTPLITGDSTLLISGDTTVDGNLSIQNQTTTDSLIVIGDSTSENFHVNEILSQGATTNVITFDFVPVKDSTYYLLDDIYAYAPNNHVAIHAFINIMTTVCTIDGGFHNWYNIHTGQINCTHTSNFTGNYALTSITFDGTGFTEPVGIYAPNDTGIDSSKLCLYATSPVGSTVSPARLVLINRLDAVNGVTVVDATVWAQVTYQIIEYLS